MGTARLYLTDNENASLVHVNEWRTDANYDLMVRTNFGGGREGVACYDRGSGDLDLYTLSQDGVPTRLRRISGPELSPLRWDLMTAGSLSPDLKLGNGLLFYNRDAGFGWLVALDDGGEIRTLDVFKNWRNSWHSILIGPGSQILFYDDTNSDMEVYDYRHGEAEARRLSLVRAQRPRRGRLDHVIYVPTSSHHAGSNTFTIMYTRFPTIPPSGDGELWEGFAYRYLGILPQMMTPAPDLFAPGLYYSCSGWQGPYQLAAYSRDSGSLGLFSITEGGQVIAMDDYDPIEGNWTHMVRGRWVRRPGHCDCLLFDRPD